MANKQLKTSKTPLIVERPVSAKIMQLAQQLKLTDLQAKIVASRLNESDIQVENLSDFISKIIFPKLANLQHPNELKNSKYAAKIIADAIESDGLIVLATDYDTDGVTSAWVATRALVDFFNVPEERIVHIIGERKSGYGITDEVVDRILALKQPIDLVISADQGSSDEPRIKRLKEHGIPFCVTDHHQIPLEGPPKSALCTVNPQQDGCNYDKTVAGCFVIFLVMSQTRQELIARGYLLNSTPSLKRLAINVALGTVADSVSLKSINNRAIIKAGLNFINQFEDVSWQAIHALNNNNEQPINSEYLGFQVATRINAASRVSDVNTAFKFLNTTDFNEAQSLLDQLDKDNINRRQQQEAMLEQAQNNAQQAYHEQKYSMVVRMQGNAGIQGIIASRIGEQYGLPTIAMTDLDDGFIAGSGRGIIDNIDLREAFQWMSEQKEGLFKSMGGHKGAAGCIIFHEYFDEFVVLFEQAIQKQLGGESPVPIVHTDGRLEPWQLEPSLMKELDLLEPYGREWEKPLFSGEFIVDSVRSVGKDKTHLSFRLTTMPGKGVRTPAKTINAIYFNAKQNSAEADPFSRGDAIQCAYQPSLNTYFGKTSLQLRLQVAKLID